MNLEVKEIPHIVRIELSNTCNSQCPHCRHHSPEKKEAGNYPEYFRTPIHMTEGQISSIIDEIVPYRPSVTLNVANEPLIAKNFRYAVRCVKEKGLAGTFNTNGLVLNEEIAAFLVNVKFDSVNVSIDALTSGTLKKARGYQDLDKLINNVELMVKVRGSNPVPRIGVTFVKTDYNYHEIPCFLEFWKPRVDVIRITGFIKEGKADITKIPGVRKEDLPPRIACKQIFRDIVIRANGDVSPCVIAAEDPDIVVGNVFRDGGVRNVWNGESLNKMRRLHNEGAWENISVCNDCDYWVETFDMKEEIKDGFLVRTPSPYTTFYNVIDKVKNWNKNIHDRQGVSEIEVTKAE